MVLLAHNFPTCNVYKPQTINGEVLNTADDLRRKLGVMLRHRDSEVKPCKKYGEDDDELRPKICWGFSFMQMVMYHVFELHLIS